MAAKHLFGLQGATKERFICALRNYPKETAMLDFQDAMNDMVDNEFSSIDKKLGELSMLFEVPPETRVQDYLGPLEQAMTRCLPSDDLETATGADTRTLTRWLDHGLSMQDPKRPYHPADTPECAWLRWQFWVVLLSAGKEGFDLSMLAKLVERPEALPDKAGAKDYPTVRSITHRIDQGQKVFMLHHARTSRGSREPAHFLDVRTLPYESHPRARRDAVSIRYSLNVLDREAFMAILTGAPFSAVRLNTFHRVFPGQEYKPLEPFQTGPWTHLGHFRVTFWLTAYHPETKVKTYVPFELSTFIGTAEDEALTDLVKYDIILGEDVVRPLGIEIMGHEMCLVLGKDEGLVVPFRYPAGGGSD